MSKQWAAEVMTLSKIVDDLIGKLPDVKSTEAEELSRIRDAMKDNEEAGKALRAETSLTSDLLKEVRSLHAVLADAQLSQRQNT